MGALVHRNNWRGYGDAAPVMDPAPLVPAPASVAVPSPVPATDPGSTVLVLSSAQQGSLRIGMVVWATLLVSAGYGLGLWVGRRRKSS